MTDTSAAPAPAAPEAPAHEVPIDTNPVVTPSPISNLPPERALSRMEAIQRAFERADNPPPKDAKPRQQPAKEQPKPAEAKKGHNQPPEDTPDEKLDLKKRPSEQPRGDRGQFAPKQKPEGYEPPAGAAAQTVPSGQPQAAKVAVNPLPPTAPYREPPPRMADHAKAEWHAAPESVRGEIYRMHDEFNRAHQYYRADHEVMNSIRPFHQLAMQQGTTLANALNNYIGIEAKLRKDLVAGLDTIVNNLGLVDPQTGKRIDFRDVAYHVLSQTPEQLKQVQQGNAQTAANQQIGALHQEISGLKHALQQMHTQQQFTYTRSQVDAFAETHPRFDELGTLIEQELKFGFDLDTAYRRAERLAPPATQAPQTRTPSAQTRPPTDRSISGAPATSTNGASPRRGPPPSRREAIDRAIRHVNGSL